MNLEQLLAAIEEDASRESATLFADLAAEYLAAARNDEAPVSEWEEPSETAKRFDEPLPNGGEALARVAARVRDRVVRGANWLAHPMAMGHQVSPPLPASIWADTVISALNNSLAVREMSPTITHVERRVIRWMCQAIGLGAGSGGTFTSGGTEATLTALLAARARMLPNAWEEGVSAPLPVVLCGAHAHYAVSRAIGILGLGVRQLVMVPASNYKMDVRALGERLAALRAEGRRVLAVVGTAGHTATGAFDDFVALADLCAEYDAWFHVDGAHGASASLSRAQRHRLRGIDRVDSLAWDPHKMMLTPLASGMLLVLDERSLERAFAQKAPYLFHATDEGVSPDIGVRSLQCSRRGDALKVWVALQRYGADGIGTLYDHLCALASALHARLEAHPRFRVLHEPDSNILCFQYVGDGACDAATVDALNLELRTRYNRSGVGWITTTMLEGERVLRVTIMNPRTTERHLERMVTVLAQIGDELMRVSATALS